MKELGWHSYFIDGVLMLRIANTFNKTVSYLIVKTQEFVIISTTFLVGLLSILVCWRILYNTRDIIWLVLVAVTFGVVVCFVIWRKNIYPLSRVKKYETKSARELLFVGIVSLSVSVFALINIKFSKNASLSYYEIIEKRHEIKRYRSPERWYLIVDMHGDAVEMLVDHYKYEKHKVGEKLPVSEIQGFFGWFVVQPHS